jgi:hypothetical protein
MSNPARNDAQRWFLGVGLAYCAIIHAGGHAALFLGLIVPVFWAMLAVGDGSGDSLEGSLVAVSVLPAVALAAGTVSTRFAAAARPARLLQVFAIACLVASAVIVCVISDEPALSLMSVMPFAGAILGYVLFAFFPRATANQDEPTS